MAWHGSPATPAEYRELRYFNIQAQSEGPKWAALVKRLIRLA